MALAALGALAGLHGLPDDGAGGATAAMALGGAPAVAAAPSQVAGLSVRAADGMFYVDGAVDGQRVRFLVDTGASVTVLTPADAARIGHVDAAGPIRMVTAVGGAIAGRGARIDRLEIAGRRLDGVQATVVDTAVGVSLLGQDVLSRLGPVTFDGDRLEIGARAAPSRS